MSEGLCAGVIGSKEPQLNGSKKQVEAYAQKAVGDIKPSAEDASKK